MKTFCYGPIKDEMILNRSLFTSVSLVLCVSDEKVIYLTPEQEKDKSHFIDKEVCV